MGWTEAEFARAQMGLSLAFHIVFAAVGVAMPALMVAAEVLWRRTGEREWLSLAQAWAKGTAVLFAVGAVSGTVLSFELGLLFPVLMERAGAVLGPAFALEGVAFFSEAICLGVYLYGRERVPGWTHLAAGIGVAVSGLASAALVTCANAWMQHPVEVTVGPGGQLLPDDPWAVFHSPYAPHLLVHSLLAVYVATGLAAAAIHAVGLLRRPESTFHARALSLCLWMALPLSLLQPLVGHWSGQQVHRFQPMKLAAAEGQYRTQRGAPLRIGGFPDDEAQETRFALELPGGLSFMATGDFQGEVQGLEAFPRADWPSHAVHYCFQVMVGAGTALAGLAVWGLALRLRRGAWPVGRRFLQAVVIAGPLGFLALEAGWIVTEMGRQPWAVHGLLRTRDAATPLDGVWVSCLLFALVYLFLGWATAMVLRAVFRPALEQGTPGEPGAHEGGPA